MGHRQHVGLALLLAVLLAGEARAQSSELRIQVGDRIRYRIGTEKIAKAVVLETDPEWLRVEDKRGAGYRLDKSALQSLAVVLTRRVRSAYWVSISYCAAFRCLTLPMPFECSTIGDPP